MNICFVCHDYPPARWGGIEIFTQTLAEGLVARGHHVWVVGYCAELEDAVAEEVSGVHVFRLPPVRRRTFPAALHIRLRLEAAIRRIVEEQKIDLVECPDVRGSLLFGHLGAPLVVRMHGSHHVYCAETGRRPRRLTPFFEKRTLDLADHLLAVSKYIRDRTLELFRLNQRTCAVLYNGVHNKLFHPRADISRDPNRILFVGRLSETKGAPYLFQALNSVFEKHPQAYLRFVGHDTTNSDGTPMSEMLVAGLPPRWRSHIEVVGLLPHEQLPIEYQRAGVAVFPSRIESWGIAICEAMACGAPVAFMKHGPGPEMIDDGWDGLLCDTNSPQAIADAIIALLSDQLKSQAMGARAAKRVAATLSLESAIERNLAFYWQCLEKVAR